MAGPLDLPEILANVLEFLNRDKLVIAAQVNSLWAEEAITLIWSGSFRDRGPRQQIQPAVLTHSALQQPAVFPARCDDPQFLLRCSADINTKDITNYLHFRLARSHSINSICIYRHCEVEDISAQTDQ